MRWMAEHAWRSPVYAEISSGRSSSSPKAPSLSTCSLNSSPIQRAGCDGLTVKIHTND